MLYKMIQDVPFLNKLITSSTIGVLLLLFTSCTKSVDTKYFVSYQEIGRTLDSIQTSSLQNNSDLVIELSNEKDTIHVSVLFQEIKTVKTNKRTRNRYISFTSLDSVIKVLSKNSFDSLPDKGEKTEPEIFFIDLLKDSSIKIIPAKQVFQVSKDDLDQFN